MGGDKGAKTVTKKIAQETARGPRRQAMAATGKHSNFELKEMGRKVHKEFPAAKLEGIGRLEEFVRTFKDQLAVMGEAGQPMPSDMVEERLADAIKRVKKMEAWLADFQTKDLVDQTEDAIVDMLDKALIASPNGCQHRLAKTAAAAALQNQQHGGEGKGKQKDGGKKGGKGGKDGWNEGGKDKWNDGKGKLAGKGKFKGFDGAKQGKGGGKWNDGKQWQTWQWQTQGWAPQQQGKNGQQRCMWRRYTNHTSDYCRWKPAATGGGAAQQPQLQPR